MFTGLIRESAEVIDLRPTGAGVTIVVRTQLPEAKSWGLGDSIALDGACLTLVERFDDNLSGGRLSFEVSPETLERTTLGKRARGGLVHIEPALRMGDPLGGHLVSGHVDGMGRVERTEWSSQGDFFKISISVEGSARDKIAPYLVEKGSIAVDGVSLTVNEVMDWHDKTLFSILLIPHTLKLTHFKGLEEGVAVNLEADMLAKYVTRGLEFAKYMHSQT